ncbi:MAG: hypothetical protein K8R25_17900 [Methanosarcinales archaeon]|nr:hypothetical protein [Methanosarcinales archaeon]
MMKIDIKKKKILVGTVFLISLLLIGSIFVKGAFQDNYSIEDYYVDEDTVWKYAVAHLAEFTAVDTPGLEDWEDAEVQQDPVTIYDIHEKKLFYTFTVTKDGKAIGEMEMAASKVLGCIMHRMILSEPLDRDSMKQKAIDIVKKEYPGWELRSTKPVCYSYPMEGVMLTLVKPETKEEKTVIIDTYTSMEVPLKEPKNAGDFGAWSLYDKIPAGERGKMVENWNGCVRNITT